MESDEGPNIDPNEDLSQILPIQQKRIIAFFNHFVMQTVFHLNNFARSCESRFMEFEYKMQKIEAALLVLESQLDSIENVQEGQKEDCVDVKEENLDLPEVEVKENLNETVQVEEQQVVARDDARFVKFFKMLHVGVPEPAVKLKMQAEGFDPNILDNPDKAVPGLNEENT